MTLPATVKRDPLKVRFASPFKLVPLPPVMTLLSELFDIVADPVGLGPVLPVGQWTRSSGTLNTLITLRSVGPVGPVGR